SPRQEGDQETAEACARSWRVLRTWPKSRLECLRRSGLSGRNRPAELNTPAREFAREFRQGSSRISALSDDGDFVRLPFERDPPSAVGRCCIDFSERFERDSATSLQYAALDHCRHKFGLPTNFFAGDCGLSQRAFLRCDATRLFLHARRPLLERK